MTDTNEALEAFTYMMNFIENVVVPNTAFHINDFGSQGEFKAIEQALQQQAGQKPCPQCGYIEGLLGDIEKVIHKVRNHADADRYWIRQVTDDVLTKLSEIINAN